MHFSDGSSVTADAIICCTGYDTDLGFLGESCGISVKAGITVHPIYNYLLNPIYPSMGFFGRAFGITPFIFAEYQAIYFTKVLSNEIPLPPERGRVSAANALLSRHTGRPDRQLYRMTEHVDYYRLLGELTGEHLIDYTRSEELHKKVVERRTAHPLQFRTWPNSYWE